MQYCVMWHTLTNIAVHPPPTLNASAPRNYQVWDSSCVVSVKVNYMWFYIANQIPTNKLLQNIL